MVEYSLAAGVRAKVDRLRLRLGGWSDGDLAAMLHTSRGAGENTDVKNERTRVERAMAGAAARGGEGGDGGRGEGEADTVLIGGLTKVSEKRVRVVCRSLVFRGLGVSVLRAAPCLRLLQRFLLAWCVRVGRCGTYG